ncbi:hypothetical protein ETU09_09530 [Apibacter muscae]|uniref:Uncharacterized protein n=1 Tax=Apibacter muscae TaxID=2509004 RepID=A0A563D9L1_9FLAO|nr:hypothetical protein [Apibacter muscae]TWP26792.1 hypothetical protein ETU09_09530 [Apibacter muscae]
MKILLLILAFVLLIVIGIVSYSSNHIKKNHKVNHSLECNSHPLKMDITFIIQGFKEKEIEKGMTIQIKDSLGKIIQQSNDTLTYDPSQIYYDLNLELNKSDSLIIKIAENNFILYNFSMSPKLVSTGISGGFRTNGCKIDSVIINSKWQKYKDGLVLDKH